MLLSDHDPTKLNSDLFRNTNIDSKYYRNKLNLFMETGRNSINKQELSAVRYFDTYIDKFSCCRCGKL
jgi:hypothetical protein